MIISIGLTLSYAENDYNDNSIDIYNVVNESWFWSDYDFISETSTADATKPKIAIDSDDNLHIVWTDLSFDLLSSGGDQDIFYRFYDSSSELWSSIELVSSESTDTSIDPVLAIDISGNVHVAWEDYTDYDGADTDKDVFYKKKNAGGSWTLTTLVSTESTTTCDEISIDTDLNENIYVSWGDETDILGADIDEDIFLKKYNSSSFFWESIQLVSFGSTEDSEYSEIQVDSISGEVHIVWSDYTDLLGSGVDFDIFYRNWNIFTSSFSDLEIVSTESTLYARNPDICLSQNGDVHVVWDDDTPLYASGSEQDIHYRMLDSSLDLWSTTEVVSTESTGLSYEPSVRTDKNDFVFVVWHDQTDYQGSESMWDIFFKYRDSYSNQWSVTDVVSAASYNLAFYPDVAVDNYGYVHCVWNDLSNLVSADVGLDLDIYHRGFAGAPSPPILSNVIPNPSSTGNITLDWNQIYSADEYFIYRDTSYIWSISNLDPIATVTDISYNDIINETGDYYYVVNARNEYGFSGLSNVEHVEIVEVSKTGLFASLSLNEILIMAGVVFGLQIIVSALTYSLGRNSAKSRGKSSRSKK